MTSLQSNSAKRDTVVEITAEQIPATEAVKQTSSAKGCSHLRDVLICTPVILVIMGLVLLPTVFYVVEKVKFPVSSCY